MYLYDDFYDAYNFYLKFCRKPCKIGYKRLEDGTKVRVSRGQEASGSVIPRPEILKERRKPRPIICMFFLSQPTILFICF
jgi:hypothetical protein